MYHIKGKGMRFNYPKFTPSYGNLTKKVRDEYIRDNIKINSNNIKQVSSLVASNNSQDTLYFWQLYSILGRTNIENLITVFYTRIFNDSQHAWFRDEFVKLGDLEYHIKGQTKFWVDIMGGGKHYKSEKILYFKHKHARQIMTEQGAELWMTHMIYSLHEVGLCSHRDKRIVYCIRDFLDYYMTKYAKEFDFNIYEIKNNIRAKL